MPVSTLGRPSVARVAQRYLIVCASLASLCTLTECVCPAASAAAEVPAAAERGGRAPLSKLPPVRANAALVAVPDGWKRLDEASGGISFVPPDDPRGERVKIMVAPPEPPRPTLRDHLEADLKAGAEKLTQFLAEGGPVAGRHPAGYETLTQVVSFNANPLLPLRGDRSYLVIGHLDGGPEVPSQPVGLYAASRELFEKHRATYDQFVKAARLPSRTVLAEGPASHPPLTLFTVHQVADFLEWQLDVPFTATQRDALREHFISAWGRGDAGEIRGVQAALAFRKELAAKTPAEREAERQRIKAVVMDHWRRTAAEGNRLAGMMVRVYDAAHVPIARGEGADPPLTRQSADATLEVLYFMASKAADADGPEVRPDAEKLEAWARGLAGTYPSQPAATKRELAGMAATWAALRAGWPELSAAQRAELAAQWARAEAVKPLADQIKEGRAGRLDEAQAKGLAQSMRNVDLYNQLSTYGALQKNYNILFR